MTNETGADNKRDAQVAVVPLTAIDVSDVGRGAAVFDEWLQSITEGEVTLERIRTVAGGLPVIGNIMALVDVLGDIVTLSKSQQRELLDWVSLGINLIGVLPAPPTMAAARMSLRPTLFLLRQELRSSAKMQLGDSLIEVLVGHLNATIVGTLDDFVTQAQSKLPGILADAGKLGEGVVTQVADGLEALVKGTLDSRPDAKLASQKMGVARSQLLNDPKAAVANIFDAAFDAGRAVGKGMSNRVARHLVAEPAKKNLLVHTRSLRAMGAEIPTQLSRLADPATQHSIGWLLQMLGAAIVAWRSRKAQGQGASVRVAATSQARHTAGDGRLEAVSRQCPAKGKPNAKKNCACTGTANSISFALGCETLQHTDFTLPGAFRIKWRRTYNSRLEAFDLSESGARWITEFTTRFDCCKGGLVFHAADGRSHTYPQPAVGSFHHDVIEDVTLVRAKEDQLVLCRGIERKETYVRAGQCYVLANVVLRNGAGVMLHYEHRHGDSSVLSDLITYQDDVSQVHLHLGTLIDDSGRLTGLWEIRDGVPVRQLCGYQYDAHGDLVQAQDENGAAWAYEYQYHLITRYTDRTGRGMNLAWQGIAADARAVREWADDGSFDTRLEWDENIRLTCVTDANGDETWHYYDILGYTYRIRYPDGCSEWFYRDKAKNLARHVRVDGETDRYTYDVRGNCLEHIRADESVVYFAFDDQNQLSKISDPEGGQWQRSHDDQGNLVETVDPLGNKTEYSYSAAGLPTSIKDANGNESTLEYDVAGQLVKHSDCSGKTSTWEYDARGQLICFTDAAGQSTEYHYVAGHLALIKRPDQTQERFEHDAEGRTLAYVDALDQCTTWSYTSAGHLAERMDAAQQTVRYRWDKTGRLIALENENQQSVRFHYDSMGRLLEQRGFDGHTVRYQYEPQTGRLSSAVDGQRVSSFSYDAMGRLTDHQVNQADQSQSQTYAYDANGNLVLARNNVSCLQWFYDPVGNLLREHQQYLSLEKPVVAVWRHEYDALNQRVATVRPDGHRVSRLTYGSGHLLGLRLDEHELVGFERDDLHREIARHQGNDLRETRQWHPVAGLQAQWLSRKGDQSTLLKREYQYDAVGQLAEVNDSRRGARSYRYDPVSRLLSATSPSQKEFFAFDPAGNLLDQSADDVRRPLDPTSAQNRQADNLLRAYAGQQFNYDERGNQIQRWHNAQRSDLTWDLFDRLVRFEDARLAVDFAYDALGRRLYKHSRAHYKQRPEAGSLWNRQEQARQQQQFGCGLTLYGWDGENLAWESSPAQFEGDYGRTVHYLFEPGSFVPLAQAVRHSPIVLPSVPAIVDDYRVEDDSLWSHQPVAPPIDALVWYQCDHLGTPLELTDQQGDRVWTAEYKVWGKASTQRSQWACQMGVENPLRFPGQYHDHETGLHYNRYRYYDPEVGRYISKDPIGLMGGLNVFQYCPNPTGWADPLGLIPLYRGMMALLGKPVIYSGVTEGGQNAAKSLGIRWFNGNWETGMSTDKYWKSLPLHRLPRWMGGSVGDRNFKVFRIESEDLPQYGLKALEDGKGGSTHVSIVTNDGAAPCELIKRLKLSQKSWVEVNE